MCDGKHSSKRDVVILSIKPKRPDFPSSQKVVPIAELLQEWDKLDAYYRGQLLKLTKSISKSKSQSKRSRIPVSNSIHSSPDNLSSKHSSNKSSPVNKKHSSSLSSDQFQELFGDENLFANNDGNNANRQNKNNKLLHSRSLNSLFEDSLDGITPTQPVNSRKNSLANANTNNLVVSIPVLSVQHNCGDNYNSDNKRYSKYIHDNDNQTYLSDEEDKEAEQEAKNFLSVPRDNFQVQYGTKQKTRVTLLEAGGVSPRWIVPVHVAPYKPPTAQGLNGIQIQKILYHKNDSINYASPTTTTARTPDKPPDNLVNNPPVSKSAKVSVSSNSPVSTVSPRSTSSGTTTPSPSGDNNNATPKQTTAQTPELTSPKSEQGSIRSTSSSSGKFSSPPPVNSTSGSKLKRPISLDVHSYGYEKKQKLSPEDTSPTNFKSMPVTSTSYSSSSSSNGDASDTDNHGPHSRVSRKEPANHKVMNAPEKVVSPKKLNIINKNPIFLKPSTTAGDQQSGATVFLPPAGISITDRIIKKASMPQPELLERQRRRRLESNQRKSYALQKGDEHEEKESIELSMKSFEMIWNIPLLSPLRSP